MDPVSMISYLMDEGRQFAEREQELQRWFDAARRSGRAPTWEELARMVDLQRETLQRQSTFCFAMVSFVEQLHTDHQEHLDRLSEDVPELLRARLRRRLRRGGQAPARWAAGVLRRLGDLLDGGAEEPG